MSTPTKTPPVAAANKSTMPRITPVAKKTESLAGDNAAATAGGDASKAIEKLETRLKAVNANNVARVANSKVTSGDGKLLPLVSLKTGKTLDKFPETGKEVGKLTLTQMNDFLTQLDAEKTGSEATRRERVRLHIGLTPNPA
ncbi:hypothetical protein DOTSEDRAFT_72858 [Dothistroma septosporum NZE10]|uniref:Uncharacterized protein n=1 Tax=Dothistroma septosporum (strain NZE10 / CBS 128990) TaxID=675120 RepID=M2YNN0_DOTSN|nr:hypothetical protein DOTSEDRAFT_72858 [Dothistroma septosporum NZE10]